MTSIFVAKLDFGVTNDDLKKAFQQYGTVLKATVAMDRETGKSRGFGFVEMADRDQAMAAIKGLDGSIMNGRQIAVKEAEQRQDNRPPRGDQQPRQERNFPPRDRDQSFKPKESFDRPKVDDDEPTGFTPPPTINPLKQEPRKKLIGKDKKKDVDTPDDRSKKTKLSPYKKSGKMNRFFDDDDDDFDPESASLFDFGDEDEDWEDEADDSEEWDEEDEN